MRRPELLKGRVRAQLGLHGDRDAGVEPEELVRPDDALQGRSPKLCHHGVQDVHPRDDPASLPSHSPGAAGCGSWNGSPRSTGC